VDFTKEMSSSNIYCGD